VPESDRVTQKQQSVVWKQQKMLRDAQGFGDERCGERVVVRFRRWGWCLETQWW